MENQIYQQNLKTLGEKLEDWVENIEENRYQLCEGVRVYTEESESGQTILKVEKDQQMLYLNGKYRPEAVVDRWMEENNDFSMMTPIVIIGLGNYEHVRRILEETDDKVNIFIYEPCINIFLKLLETVDMTELFRAERPVVLIVEGINGWKCTMFLQQIISFDNVTKLKLFTAGNYNVLFQKEVSGFVSELKEYCERLLLNWNTAVRFTSVNAQNVFSNIRYLYEGYNILDLYHIMPPEIPTIVVSAGPSLNKNIKELKKAEGKACIIATDTAMKPLLNAGIRPNMFLVVDGLKPGLLFEHKDISKVPMVAMTSVSTASMDTHKGKKIFYQGESTYEDELIRRISEKMQQDRHLPSLVTAGSVATSAFSLGVFMGSKTVILVGQDLALTGNRTHADGTFKDKMDEIDLTQGRYIEVEDVHGGKVYTRDDFKYYLDWFENTIKDWPMIKVIDATEGGAKIHGARIMTLRTAIKKECKRDYSVKWRLDRMKPLADEAGREVMLEYFRETPRALDKVMKKSKQGVDYYKKLMKLAEKKHVNPTEHQKVLKKIASVNRFMETDYMAGAVMASLKGIEFTLRPSIYDVKEERRDEMTDIAKQGMILLGCAAPAAESIKAYAEKTVVKFAEEKNEGTK